MKNGDSSLKRALLMVNIIWPNKKKRVFLIRLFHQKQTEGSPYFQVWGGIRFYLFIYLLTKIVLEDFCLF